MEKHAAHSSSASSMTARSGSAPASSARSMAGGGGGGGGAAEGGARKVLARSTSFGEFVEADDDVADAGDDVEPRAAGGSGGGGGAARGFRASSAGPVPTLPGGADGAAGGGHHAGGVARAAAMRRSATSPEGVLQRPGTALGTGGASELKALRQSKSFAGGDSGAGGLLMSPMLETVREGALTHAHAHAQPARHRACLRLAARPHVHGHYGHPNDLPLSPHLISQTPPQRAARRRRTGTRG